MTITLPRMARNVILAPYRYVVKKNRYRSTDIYAIAYPRSGSTWTRFFLGRYVQLLTNSNRMHMFGEYSIWGRCEKAKIGPAINFSHDGLNWTWQTPDDISYEKNLKPYCGKKILFLTRYPLDVVVSNWAYFRYLNAHYQNSVNAFIKDPVHSVEKFVRFHNLWANHRSEFPEIMLLRYEDVRNNPKEKFAELIHYLGFNYDEKLLMEAINFASLENMRGMQKSLKDVPFLKTKNYIYIGDENNPESRHVRKGEIGGYRKYLDPDMVDHYEKIIGLNLDPWFGYEAPVA